MKQPIIEATPNPAHILPRLDLSKTVAARREAFSELDAALSAVRRARQGFDELKGKAAELERRAAVIEREIANVGGAEAAARALGLSAASTASTGPNSKPVATLAKELDAARAELRETLAALAAAPSLFSPLLARLKEARPKARDAHRKVIEATDAWTQTAREMVMTIRADERFLIEYVIGNYFGVTLPAGFASLDRAELDTFTKERAMIDAAENEARPLVSESDGDDLDMGL